MKNLTKEIMQDKINNLGIKLYDEEHFWYKMEKRDGGQLSEEKVQEAFQKIEAVSKQISQLGEIFNRDNLSLGTGALYINDFEISYHSERMGILVQNPELIDGDWEEYEMKLFQELPKIQLSLKGGTVKGDEEVKKQFFKHVFGTEEGWFEVGDSGDGMCMESEPYVVCQDYAKMDYYYEDQIDAIIILKMALDGIETFQSEIS